MKKRLVKKRDYIQLFGRFIHMFRFAITKFNLMTPGREDMDVEETSALSAVSAGII